VIGEAIFGVIKPLYREGERMRRRERQREKDLLRSPRPRRSKKELVFEVLPEAIANAGAPFSARDLYYAVRPLLYRRGGWPEGEALDYGYFSQTLLLEWQEEHGRIEGLWRDPRGHLHEPHTRRTVALGTREVAAYEFPPHAFDKVLYVEKEGEWPKLRAARLAERYDMAVVSGKGYPAEAARALFERAEGRDFQLFVFHDADLDGYNIARVMREATRRMPGYSVDVVDLGLTVEDALDMGLEPEPFSRKKDVSDALRDSLSDVARQHLYRPRPFGKKGVEGERFELNAIIPTERRVAYVERKLEENGVRGKVIPPDDALSEEAREVLLDRGAGLVREAVEALLRTDEIAEEVAGELMEGFDPAEAREQIKQRFGEDPALSWRAALKTQLLDGNEEDAVKSGVEEALRERLADTEGAG
jgi:hypothetical protein